MCVRWEEPGILRWKEVGISDGAAWARAAWARAAYMLPTLLYVGAWRIVTYNSAARCVART